MPNMSEEKEIGKETILFHQLILSFHTAAWQQMGKVVYPLTGKIEVDLPSAAFSIDMLDMIESKTKGNLTKMEADFLHRTIGDLKLNYIDELRKQEAQSPSPSPSASASPETEQNA
jgi:hypothetical protein